MRKILYLLLLVLFISCNDETSNTFSKDDIKEFSKSSDGNEIFYNADIMFVKTKNEKYGATNIEHLFEIYSIKYNQQFKNFDSFLFDALNQKIIFDEDLFKGRDISVFSVDKKLENEFKNQGTSVLLKKYFKKSGNKFAFYNEKLSDDRFYTLMYYFFMNDYEVFFDDYAGFYYVKSN